MLRTTFLSREPDFQEFLKKPQTYFVGVFWVFQCIFLALFDIWAENRIFEPRTRFSRNSWKASKHVYLVFSWCFMGFFLALYDIWAENRIFEPRKVFQKIFLKPLNMFRWCFLNALWHFQHCSTSELRTGFLSIGRTSRQPNYPNQLAPKRGSERSLRFGPQSHLVSLSGNLPIVQARDTLSRRSYQPIVLA